MAQMSIPTDPTLIGGMPKKGASQAEFAAYYKRLRDYQAMGDQKNSTQPLPGESLQQFKMRMADMGMSNYADNPTEVPDNYKLNQLQQQEEDKARGILGEQTNVQKTRLQELASLLAKQQDAQFNRDIPGIADTAQGKGMLETSGFGGALANRYKELTAGTSEEIAKQALADRDLEIKGIGDIGTNANNLSTAGLQRNYSTEDLTRSEALARDLAKYGVPAPSPQPSTTDKFLQYSGPILTGVGAVKGAAK